MRLLSCSGDNQGGPKGPARAIPQGWGLGYGAAGPMSPSRRQLPTVGAGGVCLFPLKARDTEARSDRGDGPRSGRNLLKEHFSTWGAPRVEAHR